MAKRKRTVNSSESSLAKKIKGIDVVVQDMFSPGPSGKLTGSRETRHASKIAQVRV